MMRHRAKLRQFVQCPMGRICHLRRHATSCWSRKRAGHENGAPATPRRYVLRSLECARTQISLLATHAGQRHLGNYPGRLPAINLCARGPTRCSSKSGVYLRGNRMQNATRASLVFGGIGLGLAFVAALEFSLGIANLEGIANVLRQAGMFCLLAGLIVFLIISVLQRTRWQ